MSLFRRWTRSGWMFAALAGSTALVGCSEGSKLEARRAQLAKRSEKQSTKRSDSVFSLVPLTTVGELQTESPHNVSVDESVEHSSFDSLPAKPKTCAPDAILTAGITPATSPTSSPLKWPGASATATPSTPAPQSLKFESAAARSKPISTPTPIPTPRPSTASRAVVTLAELGPDRSQLQRPPQPASYPADAPSEPVPVPHTLPVAATRVEIDAQFRQAEEHNRAGLVAATKGAVFSARTEFLATLRLVAVALDGLHRTQEHTAALASGLTAIAEAEDFSSARERAAAEADLTPAVRSHTTQLVTEEVAKSMSPAAVRELYLDFARQRLAFAVAGSRTGSVALHRLGKVALIASSQSSEKDARGTARVFLEAALMVDADNFPAANDLAVELVEAGYYDRALAVLRSGIARSPQPAMWNNLATIHDRRREPQLAEAARREAQNLASRGNSGILPAHNVAWVDAGTFAAASRPNMEMQTVAAPQAAPTPTFPTRATLPSAGPAAVAAQTPTPHKSVPQRAPISTALTPRRNAMVQ